MTAGFLYVHCCFPTGPLSMPRADTTMNANRLQKWYLSLSQNTRIQNTSQMLISHPYAVSHLNIP